MYKLIKALNAGIYYLSFRRSNRIINCFGAIVTSSTSSKSLLAKGDGNTL
jgi:hypothetical protein